MPGSDNPNRREFLTAAAGGAAALGMAGLAGCTDVLGSDSGTDFDEVPQWLPAPNVIDSNLDHYEATGRAVSDLVSQASDPHVDTSYDVNDDDWNAIGHSEGNFGTISADDIDYAIEGSGSHTETREYDDGYGGTYEGDVQVTYEFEIIVGTIDADWIDNNLDAAGFSREGTREEFMLYDGDEDEGEDHENTAFAVREDALIKGVHRDQDWEEPEPEPVDLVESIVDAREDLATRYHEDNSDLELLLDNFGAGHVQELETFEAVEEEEDWEGNDLEPEDGHLVGLVAEGTSQNVNMPDADVENVLVFQTEPDLSRRDIEEYVEESGEFRHYQGRPEIEIDERVATISGEIRY